VKRFVLHYLEMVAVMFAGMGLLSLPVGLAFDIDRDGAMLLSMGATMTAPMIPWMRWRGHDWRPTLEMAASMVIPTLAVLLLLGTEIVTDLGALLGIEHVAMLGGMLGVMLARRDEYSHHAHAEVTA
jgi:hypothetical protein